MALQREAIYTALLTRLQAAVAWKTPVARRLLDLSKVPPDAQPTAFLIEAERESSEFTKGRALKWTLTPSVIVYARVDDLSSAPGTVTNQLLTAIEVALEDGGPGGNSPTSLAQTVSHCRIASVDTGAGHQDGQAVIVLGLDVLAVAS